MNLLLGENIDTNVGRDLRKVLGTSSGSEIGWQHDSKEWNGGLMPSPQ